MTPDALPPGARPRYIRAVRGNAPRLAALLAVLLAPVPAEAAELVTSSDIAEESVRTHRSGNRIVTFWWLPSEYWMAVARELKKTPAETSEIRNLFRSYTIVAALDVEVRPDSSFDALSTAEVVRRLEIDVNGERFEVMRQVDPRLQQLAPELSYLLRTSLAGLGSGLRILPLPNLGKNKRAILSASSPGTLKLRYRVGAEGEIVERWWHAPLTSVNGAKRCKAGQRAEASWSFCPWDGTPLVD